MKQPHPTRAKTDRCEVATHGKNSHFYNKQLWTSEKASRPIHHTVVIDIGPHLSTQWLRRLSR